MPLLGPLDRFVRLCDISHMKGLANIVTSSHEVLGGTPVFTGTRVPVQNLLDCLEEGDSMDLFLYDFPTVKREQVVAMLEAAKQEVLEAMPA
jgi:uncharacterized protein (DUF433 family)